MNTWFSNVNRFNINQRAWFIFPFLKPSKNLTVKIKLKHLIICISIKMHMAGPQSV